MLIKISILYLLHIFQLLPYSSAITSSDDRFVKKYAMMKVYESCYGQDVLKEVRKEMKEASNKCSGIITSASASSPAYASSTNSFKISPPYSSSGSSHKNQYEELSKTTPGNTVDVAKLQQVIMAAAGYKNIGQQQQQQNQQQNVQQTQPPQYSAYQQQQVAQQAALQQQSAAQTSLLQQTAAAAALSQLPQLTQNQLRPYYNNMLGLGSMFFPNNLMTQSLNPFLSAASGTINPYTAALYTTLGINPFFPGRSSRDISLRGLDAISSRMNGKVKNVTCVMQELGYLDSNLEPDYTRMVERINRLPVTDDLKRDMADGVEYCRQFSSCVPDDRRDKIAREMIRPMFFFRCYKHKKLESCIMKDIRERYSNQDDYTDDTFTNSISPEMRTFRKSNRIKSRRNNKNKKFDDVNEQNDAMTNFIYEFLYGDSDDMEFDAII